MERAGESLEQHVEDVNAYRVALVSSPEPGNGGKDNRDCVSKVDFAARHEFYGGG